MDNKTCPSCGRSLNHMMSQHEREDGPTYREMWFGEGDAEPWQTLLIRIGVPLLCGLIAIGFLAILAHHVS